SGRYARGTSRGCAFHGRRVSMKPSSVPLSVLRGLVSLGNQAGRGAGARGAIDGVGDGAVGSEYLSVIEFRNLTTAISRLSISAVVFASRNMCASSSVMATNRPEAVLFMATEIAAASSAAFSAGLACD